MEPRRLAIFSALHRENFILGAERELVLVSALLSFTLIFVGLSPVTIIAGTLFWGLSLYFLREMGKADPKMSQVYLRHIRYKAFYFARSKIWRRF